MQRASLASLSPNAIAMPISMQKDPPKSPYKNPTTTPPTIPSKAPATLTRSPPLTPTSCAFATPDFPPSGPLVWAAATHPVSLPSPFQTIVFSPTTTVSPSSARLTLNPSISTVPPGDSVFPPPTYTVLPPTTVGPYTFPPRVTGPGGAVTRGASALAA
ncbi:hypothetical protein EJ06DRAFT_355071 [Trichodelitschia bisporula]|uniref:Uncharacterized protein n=1 Tax=Trichodelitschia bisporula TaxID=703511 RepID=A0A6G1I0G5_9PEZI|nr:hypothetical protein EJ06DRAFT_355071 [Trichodelitschia bisporula]